MEIQFSEKKIEGVPVFELEGKIMGASKSFSFCDRLTELVDSGEKNILLDFSKVQWINSAGIGMMMACVKKLRENGGDLHFVGLRGRVAYYFKISKIDSVLQMYQNRDEALKKVLSTEIPF
ncbi:MAG: STAS domain-containing protein [bacterium]